VDHNTYKLALLLDLRHLIRSGYRSVAGKLGPFQAVKTGLGERPKKKGIPRRIELRQINTIIVLQLHNYDSMLRVL
jgi:hypothetical protein